MGQNGHHRGVGVVADTRHLTDAPLRPARRERDRAAMRALIADRGFDHAVESIATAVAVELVDQSGRDGDDRLEAMAHRGEAIVLEALVHFARSNGWRGSR